MSNRSAFAVTLATILVFVSSTAARAQVVTLAQLNGTVTDPSGAVVANAAITLTESDTNRVYTTTTNTAGNYLIPNVPPGRYELSAESAGFAKYTRSGVVLTVGQAATINVTLTLQGVTEAVKITGEAPPIEPTRTEVSQTIDTAQISSLPVSGRLFTDFALLTPGVATGRTSLGTTVTEFEVTQISFAGMRSFSNLITVDGADFINANTGVQRATPPQESVKEFRVVNNGFGAEYGRALGGIVNVVTKSGTNSWLGTAYEYFQNDALHSRSILQPEPLPDDLTQNQFGVSLGGPIRRDRTFVFGNYEGQRRRESPVLPPSLLDNLAIINQAKAYLGIPAENVDVRKTKDNDYAFVRIDHQLTPSQSLAVRYNMEDTRGLNQLVGNTEDGGGIGTPSGGRNLFVNDQAAVGTLNSTFKTNWLNTLLVQYARRVYNFPGATGEPNLDIPNDLSFGHNFGIFDAISENSRRWRDTSPAKEILGWRPTGSSDNFDPAELSA